MKQIKSLVLGGAGFIGTHLVKRLKEEGHLVTIVDKKPKDELAKNIADRYIQGDLTKRELAKEAFKESFDYVFQLAAKVGGASLVNSYEKRLNIFEHNLKINRNIEEAMENNCPKNFIFASSICMKDGNLYPDPQRPSRLTDDYYWLGDDNLYGVEKAISGSNYRSFFNPEKFFEGKQSEARGNLKIVVLHNIYGKGMEWDGDYKKFIPAICAKIGRCKENGKIEVWGNGKQTRSFLWVSECVEGLIRIAKSDFTGTIELGSSDIRPINEFAEMLILTSGKNITIQNNLDNVYVGQKNRIIYNEDIENEIGWRPSRNTAEDMKTMYGWVRKKLEEKGEYIPPKNPNSSITKSSSNQLGRKSDHLLGGN